MKTAEIREKTDQELSDELEGCKRELFNLRFQWQTEDASNPAQYQALRRDIARINTVLRERQIGLNADLDGRASVGEPEEAEGTSEDTEAVGAGSASESSSEE